MNYKVMPAPSVSNPATHDTEEAGSAVNLSFAEEFSSPFKLPVLIQASFPLPQRFNARTAWKRAFVKIKTKRAVQKVNDEIVTYGTNELLADNVHYKDNIDNLLDKKVQKRDESSAERILALHIAQIAIFHTPPETELQVRQ